MKQTKYMIVHAHNHVIFLPGSNFSHDKIKAQVFKTVCLLVPAAKLVYIRAFA